MTSFPCLDRSPSLPGSIPSPVVGKNIYADSGRGIFLINQLMDEVRFEKNGTEIWMIKGPKTENG